MQNMQNMAMLQQQLGMAAQMQNMGMPRGGMGGPGQQVAAATRAPANHTHKNTPLHKAARGGLAAATHDYPTP